MDYTVKDRFLKYVQIDTQADPLSGTFPSSAKQKNLTVVLCEELDRLGISYTTNDAGYIYAHLPSNIDKDVPKIFFCGHIDTAPDCSGTDVKPLLHTNYQGQDLTYPDDPSLLLSPAQHPNLKEKIGHDIITASGLTLLGSDDKSGVAIIDLHLYGEMHRSIPELVHFAGFRMAEVPVNHRPRVAGKSKYGLSRTFRVLLDLITILFIQRYGDRPMHLFGGVGILAGGLGLFITLVLAFSKIWAGITGGMPGFQEYRIGERPLLLLGVLLIILGVQFVVMGILAELTVRTYYESQNKPVYFLKERLDEQATK